MSKKKLTLKRIRESLSKIDVYYEIYVKKIDKSIVRFLIVHNRGFNSFETGPRIAKKLIQEIEYVKASIKVISGFDALSNKIVFGRPPPDVNVEEWFKKVKKRIDLETKQNE